jgi:hypothetical protein
MKQKILGLLIGGLVLATASPALAATVTVQIEGQTLTRGPVTVTTPATVTKDGTHACPGATAIGALEAATSGGWTGAFSTLGATGTYTPEAILGEAHAFGSGGYWSIYLNNRFQNVGACQIAVHDGDEVLIFASDDTFTPGVGGFDEPVVLTAPSQIVPGQPFTVTVKDATTAFDPVTFDGSTTFVPAAGATVTAGSASATTGADGTATLTVNDRGPVTVVATRGNRVPDRTVACATDGADGFCGIPAAAPAVAAAGAPCATSGDDGRCGSPDRRAAYGFITSVANGMRFAKGKGPRELTGRVDDEPSGIADIRLRLTRTDGGACSTYDARKEALVSLKRCGAAKGMWFSVGTQPAWRYLLPSRLGRGRYVLDVEVVDQAGNRDDALARGRNRVVFVVA